MMSVSKCLLKKKKVFNSEYQNRGFIKKKKVLLSLRNGGILQLLSSKAKSKVTFLSQVIAAALKMKERAFCKQRTPIIYFPISENSESFQILLFDN